MMKRAARIFCLILFFFCLHAYLCPDFPDARASLDVDSITGPFVYPEDRRLFPCEGGYLLVSHNGKNATRIAFVVESGEGMILTSPNMVYQSAATAGEYLYVAGMIELQNPSNPKVMDDCVGIYRVHLSSRDVTFRAIRNVQCDFSRGMHVSGDGVVSLVTAPINSILNSSTPFSHYRFSSGSGDLHAESTPSSQPESSKPAVSASSSSHGSIVSSPGNGSSENEPFLFRYAITVAILNREHAGQPGTVSVLGPDGVPITSGAVGTGSTIRVIRDGTVTSSVTAVVLGDIVGSGKPNSSQNIKAFYRHLTGIQMLEGHYLTAADLNEDGLVNTSDLLRMKKAAS